MLIKIRVTSCGAMGSNCLTSSQLSHSPHTGKHPPCHHQHRVHTHLRPRRRKTACWRQSTAGQDWLRASRSTAGSVWVQSGWLCGTRLLQPGSSVLLLIVLLIPPLHSSQPAPRECACHLHHLGCGRDLLVGAPPQHPQRGAQGLQGHLLVPLHGWR